MLNRPLPSPFFRMAVVACALAGVSAAQAVCLDDAQIAQLLRGMGFDFEPDAVTRFGFPDRGHSGAGITGDHGRLRQYVNV